MTWQTELEAKQTSGVNCDVTTADIIAFLDEWSTRCSFTVSDVGHDRFVLTFSELPDDVDALARAIYAICPDTVEQGFGCMAEAHEHGMLPDHLAALLDGVDLDAEDYGVVVMARGIARDKLVTLWWD